MERIGNRGTDHGHASVMLLLGAASMVAARCMVSDPGLDSSNLYENRNFAVTTDCRHGPC